MARIQLKLVGMWPISSMFRQWTIFLYQSRFQNKLNAHSSFLSSTAQASSEDCAPVNFSPSFSYTHNRRCVTFLGRRLLFTPTSGRPKNQLHPSPAGEWINLLGYVQEHRWLQGSCGTKRSIFRTSDNSPRLHSPTTPPRSLLSML